MKIIVDRNIYSDYCVSSAVYSLSGAAGFERCLQGDTEEITVTCKDEVTEDDIKARFLTALNDFKLREIINTETKDIKTILYAKALGDGEAVSFDTL